MPARLARDDEVATWRREGWVLLEGLIDAATVDAALDDFHLVFPTAEAYHADPAGEALRHLGRPAAKPEIFHWPDEGPGFRPEQHRWTAEFPYPGTGALNRLCVHPSIVDFARRALGTEDLRLYQSQITAKYTGFVNYEQPMHTDRNHSWLPPTPVAPWWHMEGFLYLSDVPASNAPTHLVPASRSVGRDPTAPLVLPDWDPELYAAERGAAGVRGSLLAYRTDVFHRAVDLVEPGGSRFLMNASYKPAFVDWVGYHTQQSRSTSPDWVRFVEGSTPDELALFGFPPPGHAVWSAELLDATARLYPKLDLSPWRRELGR